MSDDVRPDGLVKALEVIHCKNQQVDRVLDQRDEAIRQRDVERTRADREQRRAEHGHALNQKLSKGRSQLGQQLAQANKRIAALEEQLKAERQRAQDYLDGYRNCAAAVGITLESLEEMTPDQRRGQTVSSAIAEHIAELKEQLAGKTGFCIECERREERIATLEAKGRMVLKMIAEIGGASAWFGTMGNDGQGHDEGEITAAEVLREFKEALGDE